MSEYKYNYKCSMNDKDSLPEERKKPAWSNANCWTGAGKYDETMPAKVYEAFSEKEAHSDAQAAAYLGIAKQTLWAWRDQYPAFKEAYIAGKTVAEARYVDVYDSRNKEGRKFSSQWAAAIYQRSFGSLSDVERDASETTDEKLAAYRQRLDKIQEIFNKPT